MDRTEGKGRQVLDFNSPSGEMCVVVHHVGQRGNALVTKERRKPYKALQEEQKENLSDAA